MAVIESLISNGHCPQVYAFTTTIGFRVSLCLVDGRILLERRISTKLVCLRVVSYETEFSDTPCPIPDSSKNSCGPSHKPET